jgi:hypothetical protein
MADDLSFTISAEDQASRAVETVQKKIQNFGSDVAKMALGVAGPMALIGVGFDFVKSKIDEYKQSLVEAKNAILEMANASAAAGRALTPGQAYAKSAEDNAKITKQQEASRMYDKEAVKSEISSNRGNLVEEFLKTIQLTNEQRENYRSMSEDKLARDQKFFDFIFQKLQQQSQEENKMAQTAIRLEKEKAEAVKKAEAEKTAAIKAEEEKRKKRVSKVQEIEDLKIQLANSGLEQLQGAELIKNLQNNVKISQKDFDKISEKVASGADGYTQDDLNNAQADLVRAQLELANETKKQSAETKKPTTALAKETVKLTVSSLREIGGSFGGGDVNNVMDRQIELLQTQIDALNKIASNTEPKSDVGVSKPIGDTNFTTDTPALYSLAWYEQNKK